MSFLDHTKLINLYDKKFVFLINLEKRITSAIIDVEDDLNKLFNVESDASKLWFLSNRPPE